MPEDDERALLARTLAGALNAQVLEASSGDEALDRAQGKRIDLVLLEVSAKPSTFEWIDRISSPPLMLLGSDREQKASLALLQKGVVGALVQPFHPEEIQRRVERFLTTQTSRDKQNELIRRLERVEHHLRQHIQTLYTVSHVGETIATSGDFDAALDQVAAMALHITEADECSIFLKAAASDPSSAPLYVAAQMHRQGAPEEATAPESLAQMAIRTGESHRIETAASIPLRGEGEILGALVVANRSSQEALGPYDRRIVEALANMVTLAVQKKRLPQKTDIIGTDREKERLRRLFEQYVSPSIVEKLMAHPDSVRLGGERQRVTVVFADIRGFSEFSTRSTPEVLVDVLNRHIAVATQAILEEGGTLDKFLGDAVMAYFNAPLSQADHALRAVRAAWKICRAVEETHANLPKASRLQFGVGVSTGDAVVGNVGAAQLMSYTVIGDAVNMGRELQRRAKGGQILIDQQVYGMVQDYVKARPMGVIDIKGHPQPEPAFEVVALHV